MSVVFSIFVCFILTSLLGHAIHWALHQQWMGFLNKAHMSHHLNKYPPSDYKSDIYRHAGKYSTPRYFILATLPLVFVLIFLAWINILSLLNLTVFFVMAVIMGYLHDRVHDSFHINNHWLSRIPLFNKIYKKWEDLHYIHHIDMSKNFGIFIFVWDRLFKSYQDK